MELTKIQRDEVVSVLLSSTSASNAMAYVSQCIGAAIGYQTDKAVIAMAENLESGEYDSTYLAEQTLSVIKDWVVNQSTQITL